MCDGREHRYRVELRIKGADQSLVVYAKGVSEAVAKADGWVHKRFPGESVSFEIFHTGYSDDASAKEHGAILTED